MAKLKPGQMTKARVGALVALWDADGSGTAYKLGQTREVLDELVKLGLAYRRSAYPTNVGRGRIVYSLSEAGRREVLFTGKRFVPIVGDR